MFNVFDMLDAQYNFPGMLETLEERKVARYEGRDEKERLILVVDTCSVPDSAQPYETAISDFRYNDISGDWVAVECYGTEEEARRGHDRWVELMTSDNIPDRLVEVSTCKEAIDRDEEEGTGWRTKPRRHDGR